MHLNKACHDRQRGLVYQGVLLNKGQTQAARTPTKRNQLTRNAVIDSGNDSKLEKQTEAEQTLTRMVEKTWVGGFNNSNNTTNNTTTELKPTQPSFCRNLHSPGFIQLNQILDSLVVDNEISVPLLLSKKIPNSL